jgi:mutator family transposase
MNEGHRVILRETDQSHSSKGIDAMITAHDIDWPQVLADRLTTTSPDVLRELLATFIHTLMGAEADALCGAGYGQRSLERTHSRNGYRHRQFDTRTGSSDLAIPKLRHGSYFPDRLLERRKRAERALTTVVATCYLLGVSTRRMDKLVERQTDWSWVEIGFLNFGAAYPRNRQAASCLNAPSTSSRLGLCGCRTTISRHKGWRLQQHVIRLARHVHEGRQTLLGRRF